MSLKYINYFEQLFKFSDKPKLPEELKSEFKLQNQLQFICDQIIHFISKSSKDELAADSEIIKNLVL